MSTANPSTVPSSPAHDASAPSTPHDIKPGVAEVHFLGADEPTLDFKRSDMQDSDRKDSDGKDLDNKDLDNKDLDNKDLDNSKRLPDRVRIYDLSREMGRDNRDILDVCDRLRISYKSHSSTITLDQADQIRSILGRSAAVPEHKPSDSKSGESKELKVRIPRVTPPKPTATPAVPAQTPPHQQILNVRPPSPERRLAPRPPLAATPPTVAPLSPTAPLTTPLSEAPIAPTPTVAFSTTAPERPAQLIPPLIPPPARPGSSATSPRNEADLTDISAEALSGLPEFSSGSSSGTDEERTPPPPNPSQSDASLVLSPAPEAVPEKKPVVLQRPPSPPMAPRRPASESAAPPTNHSPAATNSAAPNPPAPKQPPRRSAAAGQAPSGQLSPSPEAGKEGSKSEAPPRTGPREIVRPAPANRTPDPARPAASASGVAEPPKPRTFSNPRPQLVGAPTRPGTKTVAATNPEALPPTRGDGSIGPPQKPARLSPRLPDLSAPPTRIKVIGSGSPSDAPPVVLADGPVRPTPKVPVKRKEDEEEEEDELSILKRAGTTKVKKKRRRRADGEGETLDVSEMSLSSAAKLMESATLKALPRPGARPGGGVGAKPSPAAATAKPKPPAKAAPSRSRSNSRSNEVEEVAAEKPTQIELDGDLTVQELAKRMMIPETDIIKHLFMKGKMVSITQVLDFPTAETVAKEMGFTIQHKVAEAAAKKTEMLDIGDIEHLVLRPPVVTIMGHVDHGKTTLLDAIRQTKVAAGEAGGITQHIGAYHVDVMHEGEQRRVVFLDTPGHEAFTAMRARGAKVTDIAILVVAADDGVQPQTVEALSHARAANVPIVVAINKVDKPDAQPDRIKQALAQYNLVPEEWGGDTPMVDVSALTRYNLDTLLEMILIVAEVGELQANPTRAAKGTVIEANLDKARGPVATLLVQNGTLRVGDTLLAGPVLGRVKAMVDDRGVRVQEAPPSSAVQVLGLSDVPAAGDEFEVYPDERQARQLGEEREAALRHLRLQQSMLARRVSLGTVSAQAQEGQLKELNLVLKTDVQGSAEAILASLQQLSNPEVQIRVLMSAPGEISETDVDLAAASNALIIGFSTTQAPGARQAADRYGVDIREYDIIYTLLEDVQLAMEGLLEPELVEEPLGQAEVRQIIPVGRGSIAGCYILSGKVSRNCNVRVRRKNDVVYEGRLDSLRRFKDDVKDVAAGFECGISVDKFTAWAEGDIIEAYLMVTKRRSLSSVGHK